MLAPTRHHLSLDALSSFLPSHSFSDAIPIISRRLQVLSYVLAEISSAAMLLDDYVRAVLNLSHRLFTAWQSIAVAAIARQDSTDTEIRRGGNGNTLLRRWHRMRRFSCDRENTTSPHLHSRHRSSSERGERKKLRVCYQKENVAARHVENARRIVVMALFHQYLQVVVVDSMDDLVLRDWIGPRHPPQRRTQHNTHHHHHHHHHQQTSSHRRDSSENRFTDLTDVEENTTSNNERERAQRMLPCLKRARSVLTPQRPKKQEEQHQHGRGRQLVRSLSLVGKRNDDNHHDNNNDTNNNSTTTNNNNSTDTNNEYAFFPVNLQVFMRAAIAFNPTACALQLMSRCVLHARHVRNVDDEVVVNTSDIGEGEGEGEGEEGLFYVVVASRAVGVCEHNEPCFGNRKFFFVTYQEPEMPPEYEIPLTTTTTTTSNSNSNNNSTNNNSTTSTGIAGVMPSLQSIRTMGRETEITEPTEEKEEKASSKDRDGYENVPESTRAWSRTIDTLTQMFPELHRRHTSVHTRDSTYTSPRLVPSTTTASYSSSVDPQEKRRSSSDVEEVRHRLSNHTMLRRGVPPRDRKDQMSNVNNEEQQKEEEEEEEENEEKEEKEPAEAADNEEEEEIRPLWLLMHSNRCSATGTFFTTTAAGNGRLLMDTPTGPLRRQPGCVDDYCVPFDQALFVPPNAGHDTMHRGPALLPPLITAPSTALTVAVPTTSIPTATETLMTNGQCAFAEELIARLNFWCARGEPRRRRWGINTAGVEPNVNFTNDSEATTTTTPTTSANTTNTTSASTSNTGKNSRGCLGSGVVLPLRLLFTRVGTIRFRPQESAVYCSKKGQQLLFLALAETTELVICAMQDSRPHNRRRKRRRDSKVRHRHSHDISDDDSDSDSSSEEDSDNGIKHHHHGVMSDNKSDSAEWGHYDHIAAEAVVEWSQGDSLKDEDEENDNNNVKNESSEKEKERSFTSSAYARRTSSPKHNRNTIKPSSLTTREKHQCRNERLKIEFRLARSKRLDAILVDTHSAKPIASLTLSQSRRFGQGPSEVVNDQVVQNTTFIVNSFSHYVAPLLRHLREDKILMVDMDRTLVDNAILAGEPPDMDGSTAATTTAWHQERGGIRGDLQLYCEERKDVHYLVTDGHKQAMRTETIYVRRGVREMLRHFHVEWGIPLILVTKSSLRRTEAILSQIFDPKGELFPEGGGRIFTAESIMRTLSSSTSNGTTHLDINKNDSDENNHNHNTTNTNTNNNNNNVTDWQLYQRNLARTPKSIIAVLHELDRASKPQSGSSQQPRNIAVLDDAPHVWVKADWPCTVSLAPYTLDRVDPPEYFSPNGLIVSMLISALYSSKCMVYPVSPLTKDAKDGHGTASERYHRRRRKEKRKDGDSDVDTSSSSSSASSVNSMDTEIAVKAATLRAKNSVESAHSLDSHADMNEAIVEENIAPAEEAVVEEVGGWNDGSHWASPDVEDVTPI
ncbi:uncharacterized protein TM35_000131680 [Trypanosoma theileri]|uniref:Uncharacterized protein n=1 Tax=Trypanosoma theileri TaxID=67003 RepID=A0A1X0NWT0_9TRYP|nr:uncharacterized protein TM35_000131680 [Trypanosoma theileri]ORC89164.1 hypothetical protein TM35_000131680 [Trypanosoma theileri]